MEHFETVLLYSFQKAFALQDPLHNLGLLDGNMHWALLVLQSPHPKLVIKSDHKSYNKTRKRVIWLEMTAINLENCWEITLLHTLPKKEIELKWVYFFSKSSQFMRRTGKKEGELKALLSLCKTWIKSFLGVDDAVTTPCKNLEL